MSTAKTYNVLNLYKKAPYTEFVKDFVEFLRNYRDTWSDDKIFIDGEFDGNNASKFEAMSNNNEIGVTAGSKLVGYCLLHLLRMAVDAHFDCTALVFDDIVERQYQLSDEFDIEKETLVREDSDDSSSSDDSDDSDVDYRAKKSAAEQYEPEDETLKYDLTKLTMKQIANVLAMSETEYTTIYDYGKTVTIDHRKKKTRLIDLYDVDRVEKKLNKAVQIKYDQYRKKMDKIEAEQQEQQLKYEKPSEEFKKVKGVYYFTSDSSVVDEDDDGDKKRAKRREKPKSKA